jgi:tetratricopeptide (TPR) repeat protein
MLKSASLANLRRNDEAIEILQALVNKESAPVAAYAELGWLLADWSDQYDAALAILRKGFERNQSDEGLLNNLAYVHLMRGEPEFARDVLDRIKDDRANSITLTATRGLLLLWEGDLTGGEELYKKAETLASQSGQRNMAISVRQKRYLELARAYLRSGQTDKAIKQIQMGAVAAGGEKFYRYLDQLVDLGKRFELTSGT